MEGDVWALLPSYFSGETCIYTHTQPCILSHTHPHISTQIITDTHKVTECTHIHIRTCLVIPHTVTHTSHTHKSQM